MSQSVTISKSGSKMVPAQKMTLSRAKMPSVVNLAVSQALARALWRETGFLYGTWVLLRSVTWYLAFNRPPWQPDRFDFSGPQEEEHFKKIFAQIRPLIIIFNNLERRFGEARADEITAKMAIPVALPYLLATFKPGTRIRNIDEIRQLAADYLGDGAGFEWTEAVSQDRTEVHYRFTKCVYILLLRAYGLRSFAGYSCLADHVVFDNVVPDVVFGRNHTLGVGDAFCDHRFRLRTPDDREKDEADYGDCYKVRYGGREEVQRWEERYKISGPKFRG